jgi:hypothetical protein
MITLIHWVAAVALSFIGLSQIYRSQMWLQYYQALAVRGSTAVRGHGAVVGTIGMAIAIFHNIWTGPVLVLTVFGWLLIAEGAFCLLAPDLSLRSLQRSEPELRRTSMIVTGAGLLVVAGVLWIVLLTAASPPEAG